MSSNGQELRQLALELAPELEVPLSYSGSEAAATWLGPISNGKALEVVSLCALLYSTKNAGMNVSIDSRLIMNPRSFYFRNEIPTTHVGQAGHSDPGLANLPELFLSAFIPKFSFGLEGRYFSVLREGIPPTQVANFLHGTTSNGARPDIAIVPGKIYANLEGGLLTSTWGHHGESNVQIRAIHSPRLSLVNYSMFAEARLSPIAILECSVNKTRKQFESQIYSYNSEFGPVSRDHICYVHLSGVDQKAIGLNVLMLNEIEMWRRTRRLPEFPELAAWVMDFINEKESP